MPTTFAYRHALEDHIAGFEGDVNPHHLTVLTRPTVFSVMARAGNETEIAGALEAMEEISARFVSPGEWLVVSEIIGAEALARDLAALGSERASFVEQSDGRVVMRIAGPKVRQILAKCVAADLHPDVFVLGQAANMLCCHVTANVARTGDDEFEVAVMRSYAGYVFDELMEMGREFAMSSGLSAG